MRLKKKFRILLGIILVFLLILFVSIGYYNYNLYRVSSKDTTHEVVIPKGSSTLNIASILKENNLIKNEKVFFLYTKLHKITGLKYGTYELRENMDVKEIIAVLQDGSKYNPDEVELTIKEGVNMRSIATSISEVTNNTYDSVLEKANDMDYINRLKEKYWFITDSLDSDDLYYKLEGYLFPDTYRLTNKDVSVEYIFDKMLEEMNKNLEKYKDKKHDLSMHQILTLASMVEKESASPNDSKGIASVFMNRMTSGMNLGSDVTARYANKIDNNKQALTAAQFQMKSLYNTRLSDGTMNGKLPIGPISTVSVSSIDAAFYPESTNNIYFIANIVTKETFFYNNYSDFLKKKNELQAVNGGL